ncbi:MAG TPA: hypothetical protein VGF99_14360 [Myxococcota bacterium]
MSLIEVMVAAALLGLGLVAILASFNVYTRMVAHQRQLLDAAFIAQSTLQRLTGLPGSHDDLQPGLHDGGIVNHFNQPAASTPFHLTWKITPQVPIDRTREIRVVVEFDDDARFELVGAQP